ncbi:MAG: DUF2075 domain-containing protein [Bacteroidales bacterium]|nr:DUF2075 domain-containing protein [Bacteroidales bacterium]
MPSLPIIFTTKEDPGFVHDLEERIRRTDNCAFLLEYPTVYIHYWVSCTETYLDKKGEQRKYNQYEVYVGESNNVIERTLQHYSEGENDSNWQFHLTHALNTPEFIVIGHRHFNKSFTLDVENRLIEYIMSARNLKKIHNGRGNPQKKYFPDIEFNPVFRSIWRRLNKYQSELFPPESEIFDSALFKASPLKRLSEAQLKTKDFIIDRVLSALYNNLEGQLIFIQGEAGTGKTVLTTSTFYELITLSENEDLKLDCHLLVNHDQQLTVYSQMAEKLDLGKDKVNKPSSFIHKHSPAEKVDVCLVDEGHLLLTQGNQGYSGRNQLNDIMERARVTVVMFDEYQILNTEEYWEDKLLQSVKNISIKQNNYFVLDHQFRMKCSESTSEWIRRFVLDKCIEHLPPDTENYEVKSFDNVEEMYNAIRQKAKSKESELSRIVATYDWEYIQNKRPKDKEYWQVEIGDWSLPWNYELAKVNPNHYSYGRKKLSWAEQPHTIDEVGSTFSIQGFDLSYVGVILGPSVKFVDGKIQFKPSESKNKKATQNRSLSNGQRQKFGEIFIRNEVKVLLTRGVKGLYIYACDEPLQKALKTIAGTLVSR